MKKFLIKWLFGKTEQLLKLKEIDLVHFQEKLEAFEYEINLKREINDLKALSLIEDESILKDKESALNTLETTLNDVKHNLYKECLEFEDIKQKHYDLILKQKQSINKKRKELSDLESEIARENESKKLELDNYLLEIESKKVENAEIKIRNIETSEYSVVTIRGKEAVIDKYGNFKEFKK
jgi:hypothetical protein